MKKTQTTEIRDRKANGGQGMNWLRPEKRLAIYLRDGLACAYCGEGIEQDAKLTLDHITLYSKGGSNEASNLVTCCHRCNSARGSRSWRTFAAQVAAYINHGVTAAEIIAHITNTRKRVIDVTGAKEIMAMRGGFSNALQSTRK